MTDTDCDVDCWQQLISAVVAEVDLEALARQTGAFKRRRGVRSEADLLRLALAYASGQGSLQTTAAWAARAGVAELSDVALLKRLRKAADWLIAIAGQLLSSRLDASALARPLRLIDATCISKPGSTGTDWRLHAVFDPARQAFVQFDLTDAKGAERFDRFPITPGEIWIGDRGYIGCSGLRHVLDHGADFLIRAGWNAFRWREPTGGAFDLFKVLRTSGDRLDRQVIIEAKDASEIKVRLVAVRKSPEAAEKDRRRLRADAKRKGKHPDARSLEAAEWIILVTSLDSLPIDDILALYRLRWQIELAFKRLKSIGGLDQLPARTPPLARAWIAAKLIIATLIGHTIQDLLDSPPCGLRMPGATALDLAGLPALA
ncbi:MAG: IS4 family transposase [Proteobacteria bacterium]|nr:IS4 family transposase [Pseudomonadota bacterium]